MTDLCDDCEGHVCTTDVCKAHAQKKIDALMAENKKMKERIDQYEFTLEGLLGDD